MDLEGMNTVVQFETKRRSQFTPHDSHPIAFCAGEITIVESFGLKPGLVQVWVKISDEADPIFEKRLEYPEQDES